VLWRRSKLGLRLSKEEAAALDLFMRTRQADKNVGAAGGRMAR
jgi:hypothetical protein